MSLNTCIWLIAFDQSIVNQCGLPATFALCVGSADAEYDEAGIRALSNWGREDDYAPRWFNTEAEAQIAFHHWVNSRDTRGWLEYDEAPFPATYPYQNQNHALNLELWIEPHTPRLPGEVVAN